MWRQSEAHGLSLSCQAWFQQLDQRFRLGAEIRTKTHYMTYLMTDFTDLSFLILYLSVVDFTLNILRHTCCCTSSLKQLMWFHVNTDNLPVWYNMSPDMYSMYSSSSLIIYVVYFMNKISTLFILLSHFHRNVMNAAQGRQWKYRGRERKKLQ